MLASVAVPGVVGTEHTGRLLCCITGSTGAIEEVVIQTSVTNVLVSGGETGMADTRHKHELHTRIAERKSGGETTLQANIGGEKVRLTQTGTVRDRVSAFAALGEIAHEVVVGA